MVPEREQIEAAAIISSTLLNKQMTESIHHSLGKPKLLLNIINYVNSISSSFGRCFGSPKEIINFVREPAKYYLVDFAGSPWDIVKIPLYTTYQSSSVSLYFLPPNFVKATNSG